MVLAARGRLQSGRISTWAQTANGPRAVEDLQNHFGNRFTSAIGLTCVENCRSRRRRKSHYGHQATTNGAAQSGDRSGLPGMVRLQGEDRPNSHRDDSRTASSTVSEFGLWKP